MELGFTCNSATNGNCTQIRWLVNVLTKIQSSLQFFNTFPSSSVSGYVPSRLHTNLGNRNFPGSYVPGKHISEFVHSPIHAGITQRVCRNAHPALEIKTIFKNTLACESEERRGRKRKVKNLMTLSL